MEITKVSTKGQVVIPQEIRKELGLEAGTSMLVTKMKDAVVLKKIKIPDLKKEFEALTNWGEAWAKKSKIRNEEDVARLIHKARGVKHAWGSS